MTAWDFFLPLSRLPAALRTENLGLIFPGNTLALHTPPWFPLCEPIETTVGWPVNGSGELLGALPVTPRRGGTSSRNLKPRRKVGQGACWLEIHVARAECPGDPGGAGASQVGGTDPLSRRGAIF